MNAEPAHQEVDASVKAIVDFLAAGSDVDTQGRTVVDLATELADTDRTVVSLRAAQDAIRRGVGDLAERLDEPSKVREDLERADLPARMPTSTLSTQVETLAARAATAVRELDEQANEPRYRRYVAAKLLYDLYDMKPVELAAALRMNVGFIHRKPLGETRTIDNIISAHRRLVGKDPDEAEAYKAALNDWRMAVGEVLRYSDKLTVDEAATAKLADLREKRALPDRQLARRRYRHRLQVSRLIVKAEDTLPRGSDAILTALKEVNAAVQAIRDTEGPREQARQRLLNVVLQDQATIYYLEAVADAVIDIRRWTLKGMLDGIFGQTWTLTQAAKIAGMDPSHVSYDTKHAGKGAYARRIKALSQAQRNALIAADEDGILTTRGQGTNLVRLNTLTFLVNGGYAEWVEPKAGDQQPEAKVARLTEKGKEAQRQLQPRTRRASRHRSRT